MIIHITCFILFFSSSLVREVAKMDGDVHQFVSPTVEAAILEKLGKA